MDCDVVVQSRVAQSDDEQEIVSCHDRLLVDGQASQPHTIFRESCFRSVSCEQSLACRCLAGRRASAKKKAPPARPTGYAADARHVFTCTSKNKDKDVLALS